MEEDMHINTVNMEEKNRKRLGNQTCESDMEERPTVFSIINDIENTMIFIQ